MAPEFQDAPEPKDRTKLVWAVMFLLLAGMVAVLWVAGQPDHSQSYVRAKHILIPYSESSATDRARALETVTQLREQIAGGASFEKLATEYSADPFSSGRGGDLGPAERGSYDKGFEEYVWSAPVGELSEIVTTKNGYHLIVVTERFIAPGDQYEMELEHRAKEALKQQEEAQKKKKLEKVPPLPGSLAAPQPGQPVALPRPVLTPQPENAAPAPAAAAPAPAETAPAPTEATPAPPPAEAAPAPPPAAG